MIYLVLYLLLEPVKRLLSPFLYPVAYVLRRHLRSSPPLWPPYLYHPRFFPLWLLLDDSLVLSQGMEYDDKEKRYPAFIWRLGYPWLKAWWWAAVRNSFVNWNNYSAWMLGSYVKTLKRYGSEKNFIEVRQYQYGVRWYCEFYIFGRWNQVGWLRGNAAINGASRFEIDIMKKR